MKFCWVERMGISTYAIAYAHGSFPRIPTSGSPIKDSIDPIFRFAVLVSYGVDYYLVGDYFVN